MDWNFLKYKFSKKFNEQIEEIDQLDFLTPHEKKYALIDYFKLDLILISRNSEMIGVRNGNSLNPINNP